MLNTALNKTLGQQSDTVYSTNMTGDWQPDTGINTNYWDNQVAGGNNLRRYNSVTHNNSTPHNWEFDGGDDYFGPASAGYGGDPFQVNVGNAYTLGVWWRYDGTGTNRIFGLGNESSGGCLLTISSADNNIDLKVNNTTINITNALTNHVWYYIAYTHDGSNLYKVYVNGSFKGSQTVSGATGTHSLHVGAANGGPPYVTVADSRCGHVHAYSAELGSSSLRQNFLASHKMHSDRVYGNDYKAISG